MKRTITRLASGIGDMAAEVGLQAEAAADLDTPAAARAVAAMLDAQAALNQARDLLSGSAHLADVGTK